MPVVLKLASFCLTMNMIMYGKKTPLLRFINTNFLRLLGDEEKFKEFEVGDLIRRNLFLAMAEKPHYVHVVRHDR